MKTKKLKWKVKCARKGSPESKKPCAICGKNLAEGVLTLEADKPKFKCGMCGDCMHKLEEKLSDFFYDNVGRKLADIGRVSPKSQCVKCKEWFSHLDLDVYEETPWEIRYICKRCASRRN